MPADDLDTFPDELAHALAKWADFSRSNSIVEMRPGDIDALIGILLRFATTNLMHSTAINALAIGDDEKARSSSADAANASNRAVKVLADWLEKLSERGNRG